MAGDWIKMRTNLDTNPRVIELAAMLQTSELHVVGLLWKVWSWADNHTLDGNAIRVTDVTLDRFTGVTGFADALRKVGWLTGRDNALSFPRFAEHNGQTAKKRAENAERVAKHRNAKSVTDVTQKVLPEKRREEKRREEGITNPLAPFHDWQQPDSHELPDPDAIDPPDTLLAFPDALDDERFDEFWRTKWIPYLRNLDAKGRAPPQQTQQAQLAELSKFGPESAIVVLQTSIRHGWKGIFPDKVLNTGKGANDGKRRARIITE
jgi:hypothetical protein